MIDRIDEAVEFPLPGVVERQAILQQQIDTQAKGVRQPGIFSRQPTQLDLDTNIAEGIEKAAHETEGFSGRQLEKLVTSIRAKALSTPDPIINKKTIEEIVEEKVKEFKARETFRKS